MRNLWVILNLHSILYLFLLWKQQFRLKIQWNSVCCIPEQSEESAWLTRREGDTSTGSRRKVEEQSIRSKTFRGALLMTALTSTWTGFYSMKKHTLHNEFVFLYWVFTSPVCSWIISKAWWTMRTVITFFPLFRPWNIKLHTKRSTMG